MPLRNFGDTDVANIADLDSFEIVPNVGAVIALEDSEPSEDVFEGWDLVEGEESEAGEGRNPTYAQVVTR